MSKASAASTPNCPDARLPERPELQAPGSGLLAGEDAIAEAVGLQQVAAHVEQHVRFRRVAAALDGGGGEVAVGSGSASVSENTVLVGWVLPENREIFAVSVADRVSDTDPPNVTVLKSPVWSRVLSPSKLSQIRSVTRADADAWRVLSVRICPGSKAMST